MLHGLKALENVGSEVPGALLKVGSWYLDCVNYSVARITWIDCKY